MTENINLPEVLKKKDSFTRKQFYSAMTQKYKMSPPQIAYNLQKRLEDGSLIRVGWNNYSIAGQKSVYRHRYSNTAENIVQKINENYIDLDFQVFELIQLNDFMNHQVAHNTIFVTVEYELLEYVFDTLKGTYPGKAMLKPSLTEYYRYLQDDEIVVGRLPSETPKGIDQPWQSRLEKVLVDVFTDKLVSKIVPENEKAAIMNSAFDSYLLDTNTMIRYAKRKGSDKRMKNILAEYEVETA